MHLCLTVECITAGLYLSVFLLGHTPPPPARPVGHPCTEPPPLPAQRTRRGQVWAFVPPPPPPTPWSNFLLALELRCSPDPLDRSSPDSKPPDVGGAGGRAYVTERPRPPTPSPPPPNQWAL